MKTLDQAILNYRNAVTADIALAREEEEIRAKRAKTRVAVSIARDELRALELEERTYGNIVMA